MSDSFADLWKSTAPTTTTTSKQHSHTLGSALPNNVYTTTKSSQYDAFSFLASSSRSTSRSITPASRNQQQKQQQQQSSNTNPSTTQSSSGDAFSSLLDASYTFSSPTGGNMSIAERQAASENARRDMLARRERERKDQEVIWSGLDAIASSKTSTIGGNGNGNGTGLGGDLLGLAVDTTTSSSTTSKHIDNDDDDDDWGLSQFSSAPSISSPSPSHSHSQSQPKPTPNLQTFDGLDEFIYSPPSQPQPRSQSQSKFKFQSETDGGIQNTPITSQDEFDFDFGDREYKYDNNNNSPENDNIYDNDLNASEYGGDEDDNILGELGKAVSVSDSTSSSLNQLSASHTHPRPRSRPRSRAASHSPPPHILGQLVEMGFSLEQARTALASTESGLDVDGALEVLFIAQEQEGQQQQQQKQKKYLQRTRRTGPTTTTTTTITSSSSSPLQPSNPTSTSTSTSTSSLPTLSTLSNITTNININKENIQQQADKLLAQASGIGMSVLKGAGVFWRERVGGAGAGGDVSNSNSRSGRGNPHVEGGKPKWMVDRDCGRGRGWDDDEDEEDVDVDVDVDVDDGKEGRIGKRREEAEGRRGAGAGVGTAAAGGFKDDEDFDRNISIDDGILKTGIGMKMKMRTGDLLSNGDEDERGAAGYSYTYTYTSPARRRNNPLTKDNLSSIISSSNTNTTTAPSSSSTSHSHSQPIPNRSKSNLKQNPKPKTKPIISTHPLPQNILTTLQKHKSTAKQKFREGAYGDAEDYYTRGINSIPNSNSISSKNEIEIETEVRESQLWNMVLMNNRALVRLKNGDANGALGDCEGVLRILRSVLIGDDVGNDVAHGGEIEFDRTVESSFYEIPLSSNSNSNSNSNANVIGNNETEIVDLKQTFQKAHRRRAGALEMRERWKEAGEGWGVFVERCWWVGEKERGEAWRSLQRCRRMGGGMSSSIIGDGMSKPKQTQTQTRKHPPTSSTTTTTTPSAASKALHASNLLLETEDLQKHALKDTIDSRIQAWLSGKESNIRALLASLDTVLWDELRWQKVGMHELVTDKQVKIGYLKAIARVHPDKLNANNTTLEQRMIANGVFAALNEAWNSFKQ